jgi:hypothetical protein
VPAAHINSRSSSTSAARFTCGVPLGIAAQTTGSSIQSAMVTITPAGPMMLRKRPVARCVMRRMTTLRLKYGCHR